MRLVWPSLAAARVRSGWLTGVLAVLFGSLGLGAVLCFRYPGLLTTPALRALYPLPLVRALLHLLLVAGFLCGAASLWLRRHKALGAVGIGCVLVAALLGGAQVPVGEGGAGPYLGLDWFLLNLIVYSAVFVPIERLFARRAGQPVLRRGWRTDLTYFFVSSLLVQVTTLLTMRPAMVLFRWASSDALREWVGALPWAVQFLAILLLTDVTQYWVHRAFHRVPWLWRFHEIHHSAEVMDWLAGSRLHIVDVAVTRGLTYIPIYLLGFSEGPLYAYVIFVSVQATFIHSNLRFELRPLRWLLATPRFHHWHHSAAPEAIDKNFAVHLPVLDRVFGTAYLPESWPESYGVAGAAVPDGYVPQLVHPFRERRSGDAPAQPPAPRSRAS
jgi:lathosterol oxidase